jgi:hypothetical protein
MFKDETAKVLTIIGKAGKKTVDSLPRRGHCDKKPDAPLFRCNPETQKLKRNCCGVD